MSYDLLVCVRCHRDPSLVLDTVDAAEWGTSRSTTKVVVAVDGVSEVADALLERLGADRIYCGSEVRGWGIGLFTLLLESISHFRERFTFSHFMTIDYDTLFINRGVDDYVLGLITDLDIGLIGTVRPSGFHAALTEKLRSLFGIQQGRVIGKKHIQGGCMTLTASWLDRMKQEGMFERDEYLHAYKHCSIADDHFMPLLAQSRGFELCNARQIQSDWTARQSPIGKELAGIKVFHPINMKPRNQGAENRSIEMSNRMYFKNRRG